MSGADELYVIEDVKSTCVVQNTMARQEKKGCTVDQVRWDKIEHVGVHVRVDHPVRGGVIAGSDEHGVALCDRYTEEVNR